MSHDEYKRFNNCYVCISYDISFQKILISHCRALSCEFY